MFGCVLLSDLPVYSSCRHFMSPPLNRLCARRTSLFINPHHKKGPTLIRSSKIVYICCSFVLFTPQKMDPPFVCPMTALKHLCFTQSTLSPVSRGNIKFSTKFNTRSFQRSLQKSLKPRLWNSSCREITIRPATGNSVERTVCTVRAGNYQRYEYFALRVTGRPREVFWHN